MVARKSIPKMPSGVTNQTVDKKGAYGISRRAQVSETEGGWSAIEEPDTGTRKPTQGEQEVPRSPARPMVRQWATPSYDPKTGRAARVGDDTYTKTSIDYSYQDVSVYHGKARKDGPVSWDQVPDAGTNTTSDTNNRKGRARPGRW